METRYLKDSKDSVAFLHSIREISFYFFVLFCFLQAHSPVDKPIHDTLRLVTGCLCPNPISNLLVLVVLSLCASPKKSYTVSIQLCNGPRALCPRSTSALTNYTTTRM